MQPRQSFDTCMPVLPNFTVSMPPVLSFLEFWECRDDRAIGRPTAKRERWAGVQRNVNAKGTRWVDSGGLKIPLHPRGFLHKRRLLALGDQTGVVRPRQEEGSDQAGK